MKLPKSFVAATAAAGIVGGAAGAMLFAPVIGSAQDTPTEQTTPAPNPDDTQPPADAERPEDCDRGPGGHHGPRLDAAAAAIGVDAAALRDSLRDGQTLAQVAEANGVDPQAVIDALVAEADSRLDEGVANGRITQDEADARRPELVERITSFVTDGPPEHPEGGRRRGPRGAPGTSEDAPQVEGSSFAPSEGQAFGA
jgi:hypothetical protein